MRSVVGHRIGEIRELLVGFFCEETLPIYKGCVFIKLVEFGGIFRDN